MSEEYKVVELTRNSLHALHILEEMMVMAKSGEVAALGICYVKSDGDSDIKWSKDQTCNIDTLIGTCFSLQKIIHDDQIDV